MELEGFADLVENMVLQHDYPGFEPRSLKLGLPEAVLRLPTRLFVEALGHPNVYVKLAALRWFQERPGIAKSHVRAIAGLLQSQDEWVRMETIKTVERINGVAPEIIYMVADLLQDPVVEVRKAAAKAAGKVGVRLKSGDDRLVRALKEVAANDSDSGVKWKAQKALRLLGAYSSSDVSS